MSCETTRFNLISFYFERLKVYRIQLVAFSIEKPFLFPLSLVIVSCLPFSKAIILLISSVTIFWSSELSNFKFSLIMQLKNNKFFKDWIEHLFYLFNTLAMSLKLLKWIACFYKSLWERAISFCLSKIASIYILYYIFFYFTIKDSVFS